MTIYCIRFVLTLDSPLHIGSGADSFETDSTVVRDVFGHYRVPGTSLAGVLRHALAEHAGEEAASALFGHAGRGADAPSGSRVAISDGYLLDFDGRPCIDKILEGSQPRFPAATAVQDCVRLDNETLTAADAGKFDLEYVPQGTRFAVEMVYEPHGMRPDNAGAAVAGADRPFAHVLFLLQLLQAGLVQIGGGTTRGMGHVHAEKIIIRGFDLHDAAGRDAWRNRPYALDATISGGQPIQFPQTIAAPCAGSEKPDEETLSGRIVLRLKADGPLLIGGNQSPLKKAQSLNADITFSEFLTVDYAKGQLTPVAAVPGSSLKGALHHRVRHILACLGAADVEGTITEIFGCIGQMPRKGHVGVAGCLLPDQTYTQVQHVAIDRLTGGALAGALYSEAPIWRDGLQLQVTISLDRLPLHCAGLLLHALLDLGQGRLPIGNGVGRGNGRLVFADAGLKAVDEKSSFILYKAERIGVADGGKIENLQADAVAAFEREFCKGAEHAAAAG